jgi:hypothetical protein
MKKALKSGTIINPGVKLDTSSAPYVVMITTDELEALPQITYAALKEIARARGVPADVVDGKFRANANDSGLVIEWENARG